MRLAEAIEQPLVFVNALTLLSQTECRWPNHGMAETYIARHDSPFRA